MVVCGNLIDRIISWFFMLICSFLQIPCHFLEQIANKMAKYITWWRGCWLIWSIVTRCLPTHSTIHGSSASIWIFALAFHFVIVTEIGCTHWPAWWQTGIHIRLRPSGHSVSTIIDVLLNHTPYNICRNYIE